MYFAGLLILKVPRRESLLSGENKPREFWMMSAMRKILLVIGFVAGAATGAQAFDGTPAPHTQLGPNDVSPMEALRNGARRYYSGDKTGALSSLKYAAENGQPMAAWKLGRMYADGDGVQEDDLKAFQYYSQIVREHGNDGPNAPDAPFVSSAFVALGTYYLNGISGAVPKNLNRAKRIFTHAASYFGDADAQFELGRIYRQSDNDRMAVRWYNLAAIKGHLGAQARLGETLCDVGRSESRRARGLMWISVAWEQSKGTETASWIGALHEQCFARTEEQVRRMASTMTHTWMQGNRPDLLATETADIQPASQETTQ